MSLKSSNLQLRILIECFPLTLKKGTGIYTYSVNLVEAINLLGVSNLGLLFLFDTQTKYRKGLKSKNALINLRSYTQFMYELYHNNPQSIGKSNFAFNINKLQSVINNYISILKCLFKSIEIVDIPEYFKPSLTEIISDSESIDYDFISQSLAYVTSLSRPKLVFRNILGISNSIKNQTLNTNYDIFHCTHLSPLVVPNIPRITTIHDIIPLLRPELVITESSLAFSKLLSLNISQSTKLIAVSEATKSDLVNICKVPESKISVVYEAAAKHFYPISYERSLPILEMIGLRKSAKVDPCPYFLFIGNIEPKKNIKRVLTAFKEFSLQDRGGFKLVIVGDRAWGFESVKDLIAEMIETKILIMTGYLSKSYLPALLSHARAFLFPSLVEGFGLPILEAMACGCPVITSKISVLTEVCGDAAIQVNPQSVPEISRAIALLASDSSLCMQLKEKGLKRNQLFSWEKCANETIGVYEEANWLYHHDKIK